MDALDAFKKLTGGAHFDLKRFHSDAQKIGFLKPVSKTTGSDDLKILSFDSVDDADPQLKKRRKRSRATISAIQQEKINHLRNANRINIWGSDIPDPIVSFEQLVKLDNEKNKLLLDNISFCGYAEPTPVQMQVLPLMDNQRELLCSAPTGSGKTASFVIPLISQLKQHSDDGVRVIILQPTRELAKQTYNEFERLAKGFGLKVVCLGKTGKFISKSKKAKLKLDVVISPPNRLLFLLKQDPPVLNLDVVQWLIVDESDKLFETGMKNSFREQLGAIYKACTNANIHRAFFSATFSEEVEKWCKLNLDNIATVSIGQRNIAVDTVDQKLVFVGDEYGKLVELRNYARDGLLVPPVLVFVQSKDRAKQLFNELQFDNIKVGVIHAELSQIQRDNVVTGFRNGDVWVLICTELMGRGIDFKGVTLVINYDFPTSAVGYIHRIGRTGRAGRPGKAITFFTEQDKSLLRTIANVLKESGCEVPDYLLKMKKSNLKIRRLITKHAPTRKNIAPRKGKNPNKSKKDKVRSKLNFDHSTEQVL